MDDTETASVGAIMAEKRAACCHFHPADLRSNRYSRMGVITIVDSITIRKANTITWYSICSHCTGQS